MYLDRPYCKSCYLKRRKLGRWLKKRFDPWTTWHGHGAMTLLMDLLEMKLIEVTDEDPNLRSLQEGDQG